MITSNTKINIFWHFSFTLHSPSEGICQNSNFTDFTALCKLYLLCYRTPYSSMMQNGYVICILLFTSVQCNLDKILNSVTEAGFWCINLPVWLFFHCVKTAFGSQKNLIKRCKKWNFQRLTIYCLEWKNSSIYYLFIKLFHFIKISKKWHENPGSRWSVMYQIYYKLPEKKLNQVVL